MTISMYATNSKYEELNFLLEMRARLKNPGMFFDLKDADPVELAAEISDLDFALEMFFIIRPYTRET